MHRSNFSTTRDSSIFNTINNRFFPSSKLVLAYFFSSPVKITHSKWTRKKTREKNYIWKWIRLLTHLCCIFVAIRTLNFLVGCSWDFFYIVWIWSIYWRINALDIKNKILKFIVSIRIQFNVNKCKWKLFSWSMLIFVLSVWRCVCVYERLFGMVDIDIYSAVHVNMKHKLICLCWHNGGNPMKRTGISRIQFYSYSGRCKLYFHAQVPVWLAAYERNLHKLLRYLLH